MCFTEFIGYTCGHQGADVLRPCPMTTEVHTNPVCTTYARRPILSPGMCPGCQRIIHARCVLTTEWEHHWMHERGVCGCRVIFPDLIKPRVVNQFQPNAQQTQPFYQTLPRAGPNNAAGYMGRNNAGNGIGSVDLSLPKKLVENNAGCRSKKKKQRSPRGSGGSRPNSKDGTTGHQPVGDQSTGDQTTRDQTTRDQTTGDQTTGIKQGDFSNQFGVQADGTMGFNKTKAGSARIHSLYATEWIDEHRQVHMAGRCKCQGDFTSYKPFVNNGFTEASWKAAYDQEQAIRTNLGSQYEAHKPLFPAWQPGLGNMPQGQGLQTGAWFPGQTAPQQGPRLEAGAWFPGQTGPQQHLIGNQGIVPQPARNSGAIWQGDMTKVINPLYSYACAEGGKMGGRAGSSLDLQGIDYIKPKGSALPLVGLPIGAGPESPEYFEHMGSFETCVLNPHTCKKIMEPEQDPEEETDVKEETHLEEVPHIVAILLADDSDTLESRLFRLNHKKSVSF